MATCYSCDNCVCVNETFPFGTCYFKGKVSPKQVNVLKDSCVNHSEEVEEESKWQRQTKKQY